MQIQAQGIVPKYFADEDISIEIGITNEEEEETIVGIDARLLAPSGIVPTLSWASNGAGDFKEFDAEDPLASNGIDSSSKTIGNLAPMENRRLTLRIRGSPVAADYHLEVKAHYHVLSDPETPIIKVFSSKIAIVMPFEANHSFSPMICSEPWPSYFNADDLDGTSLSEQEVAKGLTQRWSLTSGIMSLANVTLIIESVEIQVVEVHEGVVCSISSAGIPAAASMISTNDIQTHDFIILAQKLDLEDRRSAFLDLRLEIKWHRDVFQTLPTVTRLSVPELAIPFGEPRVLASAQNGDVPPGAIYLDYIIENPSMYALPFQLTMDISEEFAFRGPKNVTVQLVPLSQHSIRYIMLPHAKGLWISPQFKVFDTHFQKSLKVNATGELRNDKKGVSIWIDADSLMTK